MCEAVCTVVTRPEGKVWQVVITEPKQHLYKGLLRSISLTCTGKLNVHVRGILDAALDTHKVNILVHLGRDKITPLEKITFMSPDGNSDKITFEGGECKKFLATKLTPS